MTSTSYLVKRRSRSRFVTARGLRHHVLSWGDTSLARAGRPPLLMLHGWMDVAASFQFVVDAMAEDRYMLAIDWRGFGLSEAPVTDSYWFPDYLGDLDALLDALFPEQAIDLLGHSMGANVAMLYAGVRPARVRRLVNLEGFGMPDIAPSAVPKRYATWLDELKQPISLRSYASADAVAERLMKNNPLLPADRAAWLAPHWAQRVDADSPAWLVAAQADARPGNEPAGPWHILGDPAHKRINAVPNRADEVVERWKLITAPVLWVEGDRTNVVRWGQRYPRSEFEQRLAHVRRLERQVLSPAGHMLHHDQPSALAQRVEAFVDAG